MAEIPQMPGIRVELYRTQTTYDNGTEITVQFEDKTRLTVEFSPDSDEAAEFLQFLTLLVNDKVRVVASRGIEITGFVPLEQDENE
jgi:hypothetical protein